MNWIMLLLLYPVLPVMTGILANEAKPKKNIVIGVTLPFEARQTEEVRAICKQYRKRLWLLFGLLTAALLPSLLFSSRLRGLFLADAVGAGGDCRAVFRICRRPPAAARAETGARLGAGERGEGVCGDEGGGAAAAMDERLVVRAAGADGLVPVASLLWRRVDAMFWAQLSVYLIDALIVAGCYASYRYLYRNRAEVVDGEVDVTLALTRVRRYHWGVFWAGTAYLTGAFSLAVWLLEASALGVLIAAGVYTVAMLALALRAELLVRAAQSRLTQQSGRGAYVDDDPAGGWGRFTITPTTPTTS